MNIAFHYCAVKALARFAGLAEGLAQVIAEYSQFIDDYATRDTIYADWADDEAITSGLAVLQQDGSHRGRYKIALVTTGFQGNWDYFRMWQSESLVNNMLIPFHFITRSRLRDSSDYTPVEPALVGDGQIISNFLRDAVSPAGQITQESLIHLGMILHVFADTYAHQTFSGYACDGNKRKLLKVDKFDGRRDSDVTKEYIGTASYLSAMGHAYAGHAPDDTNVSFFALPAAGAIPNYARSNYMLFIEAAEHIYNYLCQYGGTVPVPGTFVTRIKPFLEQAFLIDNYAIANLMQGWQTIFSLPYPGIGFNYDEAAIIQRHFPRTASDPAMDDETVRGLLDITRDPETAPVAVQDINVSTEFYQFSNFANRIRSAVRHG
jgi:hypothetical protein